jgi:hypothetical protein
MACHLCRIIAPMEQIVRNYAETIFYALSPGCLKLLHAWVGLWFIWTILYKVALKGDFKAARFVKALLLFSFVQLLLRHSFVFWDYFYKPFYETSLNLVSRVMQIGAEVLPQYTLHGMLEAVEQSTNRVFSFAERIHGLAAWNNPLPYVTGFILKTPFFILWLIFALYSLQFQFILLAVTALAPLLVTGLAFAPTRGFAYAAIRLALFATVTLLLAVIAMSVTLVTLDQATLAMQIPPDQSISADAQNLMTETIPYWALCIFGFLAVFLQVKAPFIANQLVGSGYGGSGVAGVVASAGGASLAAAGRGGASLLGRGLSHINNRWLGRIRGD